MKIAVDKNSYQIAKDDGNEYIYLFKDETLEELLATKLHCFRYDVCGYVDINLTNYDIDCFKKSNINEKDFDKMPEKIDFLISIVIPNYSYAEWLPKCLGSILKQTYKNYEIIFVDDVSTDNSIEIANKYKKEFDKISKGMKVISLKQKRLNGGARNEAYLHINEKSKYIYYIDADDWLYANDVLEKINNRLQDEPDVLFVGMAQCKNQKITTCFIPTYKDKYEAIAGWSGSCGKVIKKELATSQKCLYNEGTLKEDRNQHCKVCIYMNSFNLLKEPVYVWNKDNLKSVTTIRDKVIWGTSTIRHYADTLQLYLSEKGKDAKIDKYLSERVEKTKAEMNNGGDKQW
ncbi:MAG: glycosyltransferase family 2 protein [Clostridia bacterium]|nr:glycosyltransferase family 2 protein [Clostridia bacterium]MBR6517076.1 glycosyltransferase family 2 protein [Bacilli bacterium]